MTHEQELATLEMLRLRAALQKLRQAATNVSALHHSQLNPEQKRMVATLMEFTYADEIPQLNLKTGDAAAWKLEKFIVQ